MEEENNTPDSQELKEDKNGSSQKEYKERIKNIDKLLTDFEEMLDDAALKEDTASDGANDTGQETVSIDDEVKNSDESEILKDSENDMSGKGKKQESESLEEIIEPIVDNKEELFIKSSESVEQKNNKKPFSKKILLEFILLVLLFIIGVCGYIKYYPIKVGFNLLDFEKFRTGLFKKTKVKAVVVPPKKVLPSPAFEKKETPKTVKNVGNEVLLDAIPVYMDAKIDYRVKSEGIETIGFTSSSFKEDIMAFYKEAMGLKGYALKNVQSDARHKETMMVFSREEKDCTITMFEEKGKLFVVISRML